jgi:drug/metabolite transporter (DMT)-like permease
LRRSRRPSATQVFWLDMRPVDIANLVLLGAIWGGSFPLLRYAAPQFGPAALIAVRLLVAAAAVLLLWPVWRELRANRNRLMVLGLINTAVPFTLFAIAAMMIPSGVNSLLNATTPIFGSLLAHFWLGERLSAQRWLGILVAFGGIGAIVAETVGLDLNGAGTQSDTLGVLCGLGAGFLYGLALCYTRRYLTHLSPTVLTAGSLANAAVVMTPLSLLALPAAAPAAGAWAAAVALGLVCTALAYILYFNLLKNVGAARAVTVTFLIPVFGIVWGAIFFGEKLGLKLLLFCGVVLVGTALATGMFERRTPAT